MRANYFSSILLGAAMTMTIVGSARAESQDREIQEDEKQIALDHVNAKQTRVTIKNLSHGIDLWHDANLKGDFDNIIKFQNKMHQLIRADIQKAVDVVTECEWQHELDLRKERANNSDDGILEKSHHEHIYEKNNLIETKKLIKAKEVLFVSLKRSRAFSNKYRLLNDYLELLKIELGIERIELADDFNQWDDF